MKIIIVAGARPNFMKVAPIMAGFRRRNRPDVCVYLVHTGQHYDTAMSDGFFVDLGIPEPDINLGVGSGTHAEQTARIMVAFEKVCLTQQPDWVLVVGDVNSTVACAMVAKKLGIQVAHVEAGLRSGDMSMPEEINRVCTDPISDVLFITDTIAAENLRREGIPEHRIHFVGNTMIDSLLRNLDRALALPLPADLIAQTYGVVTLHRPANVDSEETLSGIVAALIRIAQAIPLVFPIHPRTEQTLERFGLMARLETCTAILRIKALSYLPFLSLVAQSRLVITDSGGIQEETTVLGIPCITMRSNTERPITCLQGTNVLSGTDCEAITRAALYALRQERCDSRIPEKWDGHAGERIVDTLIALGTEAQSTVAASA